MIDQSKQILAKIPAPAVYAAIVVLSSTASFGLGMLVSREMDLGREGDRGFWVEEAPLPEILPASAASALSEPETQGGAYVASKSGSRYYLPSCSGAKQIKEENKVWFETKEAAEAAGYTPAKNCKGI